LEPAVEGQATQAMVRRTGPRPGARVSSEPQSAQPAPQAATADENVPLEATVRPDDSGTVPADPSSANDKVKAAGHDPSNPPGDAKVADLSASHNASAQASDGAGRRSDDAATTDAADRARFVQRVARAFESAVDHAGQVRLRLHPPELGSLRLDLTIRNGQMSARLETETEAARNMLMENLPELKERLAGHHIQVERFDIEWRGQAQGGLPQRSGDHDRWQPPPSRAGRVPGVAGGGSGPDAAAGAGRRLNPGTSFDVVI
jgi:flagellar hook-length control protein FliK